MTINQKLNKVLEYLVNNKQANNIYPPNIKQVIFNNEISMEDAEAIHRKLLESGYVRVRGPRSFLSYSVDTEIFLNEGGYGGDYIKSVESDYETGYEVSSEPTSVEITSSIDVQDTLHVIQAFMSYAWGDKQHEEQVLKLTEYLRNNGVDARIDKMLSQEQTAINFKEMMYKAMNSEKVIVVLSKNYKMKADEFSGGVGTEFLYMVNDMKDFPERYILASFEGHSKEVIPNALKGYDIVNLSSPKWEEDLFRKITGERRYTFSPVVGVPPVFGTKQVSSDLSSNTPVDIFKIDEPQAKSTDSGSAQGRYTDIGFKVDFKFKNLSQRTLDGFTYTVKVLPALLGGEGSPSYTIEDGYAKISTDVQRKVYPDMEVAEVLRFRIMGHNVKTLTGSKMTIVVFSEIGTVTNSFPVEKIFKIRRDPTNQYSELIDLDESLFRSRRF